MTPINAKAKNELPWTRVYRRRLFHLVLWSSGEITVSFSKFKNSNLETIKPLLSFLSLHLEKVIVAISSHGPLHRETNGSDMIIIQYLHWVIKRCLVVVHMDHVFPGVHTCYLWSGKTAGPGEGVGVGHNFSCLKHLRTGRVNKYGLRCIWISRIINFWREICEWVGILTIIVLVIALVAFCFGVQKAATSSSDTAHSMKVAWLMKVGLRNNSYTYSLNYSLFWDFLCTKNVCK